MTAPRPFTPPGRRTRIGSDTKVPATDFSIPSLIAERRLRAVFQPIVALASEEIVGYEALARGPAGSPLEMPVDLFSAAHAAGVQGELDRACREVALTEAIAGGLEADDLLFINVEPAGLDDGGVLDRLAEPQLEDVSVVVEFTERTLTTRPAEVLAAVRWLRERDCRIALDDVGVDRRSLALMPFLAPDVIKLDLAITQDRLDPLASALNAVGAEAERSGAMVVAEGIETEEHRVRALAMGAVFGQGWYFGRPAPLPIPPARTRPVELRRAAPNDISEITPFERVTAVHPTRTGEQKLVTALSHQLEDEALSLGGEAVIVTSFQHARHFTDDTLQRYEELAGSAALVAAIGVGMQPEPGVGVRGGNVPADDTLRIEWDVIVIGPHFAAAFVAQERDPAPDTGVRQFDYVVTYERELAIDAARCLLRRILPSR